MYEFMGDHPVLTFFIVFMILGTIGDIAHHAFGG